MTETKTLKGTTFSNLSVGDKFYQTKTADAKSVWTKTESVKNGSGWTNAKNTLGFKTFIKYDTRVWIEV